MKYVVYSMACQKALDAGFAVPVFRPKFHLMLYLTVLHLSLAFKIL